MQALSLPCSGLCCHQCRKRGKFSESSPHPVDLFPWYGKLAFCLKDFELFPCYGKETYTTVLKGFLAVPVYDPGTMEGWAYIDPGLILHLQLLHYYIPTYQEGFG